MSNQIPQIKTAIVCLLLISQLFVKAFAADVSSGVNFRQLTLEQALAASKKENKPLFIHGFTDWCHFCMYMKDSVYTDKEVSDFVNANFISIKMDMEKEGKALNTTLKAHTYPVLLYYDVNGELMHRAAGRRYKQPFLELCNEALDPKRQMRTFKNKYENGTATPNEVQFYFRMQEIAGMDAQPMLSEYLMKQSDSDFTNKNNWRIMYDIIKDPALPVMKRFLDNKKVLEAKYTTDSVNNKLINLYNSYMMKYVQQLDSVGFENAKKAIRSKKMLDISEKICAFGDLNKLKMTAKWDLYKPAGKIFVEKYAMNDFRRLNEVANVYYEHYSSDPASMQLAEKWALQSVSLADLYKGNHLLASISYIMHKKEQALKAANHAIELAKRDNNDYRPTQQLLDVINKME